SLPRSEFNETYQTLKILLAQNENPRDLIVEDPFLSVSPIKVDLRQHLENLLDRMSKVKDSITTSTQMVTIDFS
ncbi:MAG: hypothetical protein KJT03_22780, partial [Verrucomicrobiae bacterium]|nr:hypothetical protein [Verrucomicrobiae bacterium]